LRSVQRRDDKRGELVLDLPAAHSAGRMGRQLVRQFAVREGMAEAEVETLEFVTSELLSNAVDHGGGNSAMDEEDLEQDVRMSLELRISSGRWELRVGDQGGGVPADVEPYLDDTGIPDLEDERGRGFFLLMQMVDELRVDRTADGAGLLFIAIKSYVSPPG
jgi:anti-sigma regulatory factor (Ser/Thr protein kinase)